MSYNAEIRSGQFNIGAAQIMVTDLNDDCLLNIFRYLNVSALGRVSDVCQVFRDVAIDAFKYEWKDKTIPLYNDSKKNQLQTSRILRQFGSMLQKVHIVFGEQSNDKFFNIIMEKCSLHLIEVDISGTSYNEQLDKILNKENIRRFNNKFKDLKRLRFGANIDELLEPQCIEQPFAALEHLSLFAFPFENRNVENFVNLNPQVKSICLLLCNDAQSSRKFIAFIDQKLPQLEELALWMHGNTNEMDYQPRFLRNVKRLSIHNYGSSSNMHHLSISNETVEEIDLNLDSCDEQSIDFICKYTELKKLAIRTYMDSPFDCKLLKELCQHLPKLMEVEVSSFYESLDYGEIVNFVNGTKQLVKYIMRDTSRNDLLEDAKVFQKKFHPTEWNVTCYPSNNEIRISK